MVMVFNALSLMFIFFTISFLFNGFYFLCELNTSFTDSVRLVVVEKVKQYILFLYFYATLNTFITNSNNRSHHLNWPDLSNVNCDIITLSIVLKFVCKIHSEWEMRIVIIFNNSFRVGWFSPQSMATGWLKGWWNAHS